MQEKITKDAFVARINELIREAGNDKNAVADKIGVVWATVHRWSRGKFNIDKVHANHIVAVMGGLPHPPASAQPRDAISPAVYAFVRQLTPEEQDDLLAIGPPLLKIYRAQQGGKDETAREAWKWIKGNILMFARGLEVPPPGKRGGMRS